MCARGTCANVWHQRADRLPYCVKIYSAHWSMRNRLITNWDEIKWIRKMNAICHYWRLHEFWASIFRNFSYLVSPFQSVAQNVDLICCRPLITVRKDPARSKILAFSFNAFGPTNEIAAVAHIDTHRIGTNVWLFVASSAQLMIISSYRRCVFANPSSVFLFFHTLFCWHHLKF